LFFMEPVHVTDKKDLTKFAYVRILIMAIAVQFYQTEHGKMPVADFLDTLPVKTVQKISWVIRLVSELEKVPVQYLKKLSDCDDIWEIRIIYSGNIYRLLGFYEGNVLILTNGFQKKSQKTPREEIDIAIRLRNEHKKR
jgi:phage-related protein